MDEEDVLALWNGAKTKPEKIRVLVSVFSEALGDEDEFDIILNKAFIDIFQAAATEYEAAMEPISNFERAATLPGNAAIRERVSLTALHVWKATKAMGRIIEAEGAKAKRQ